MIKALIMAGGIGERLWPLSTKKKPKHFHSFNTDTSLIEETINRLSKIADDFLIVTTVKQLPLFKQYLPKITMEKIITEPFVRDTAPAIALGSIYFDDDDIMIVVPADHVIKNEASYLKTMKHAVELAKSKDFLITIGIVPKSAHTGYGYIERGSSVDDISYMVNRFHEKPDRKTATEYLASKRFYWNSGMFVWKKSVFTNKLARYLKNIHDGINKITHNPSSKENVYRSFPKVSIDNGLMEKSAGIVVVESNFYWNDVGCWDSIYEINDPDDNGNVIKGSFETNNVKNSLLINETDQIIGISDIESSVYVHSGNGTLLCKLGKTQNIRRLFK
ncbi:MAG: mannose-1-phosphate guanylyltransferase [Thermotogota bacterium]|nr:mannose-1-phosphate guanylyltransferase [Thermotogota bacterium]